MIHALQAADTLLGPEDKVLGAILTMRQVKEGPLIKWSEVAKLRMGLSVTNRPRKQKPQAAVWTSEHREHRAALQTRALWLLGWGPA